MLDPIFDAKQLQLMTEEFEALKGDKLETKSILRDTYDADQKRFEIIKPPILHQFHKSQQLKEILDESIHEKLKANNRNGYFCYFEGSYIKPHFDHILTDCMLLVCVNRHYGNGEKIGGLLRLYIPKKITFDHNPDEAEDSFDRIEELNLKIGDTVFVSWKIY